MAEETAAEREAREKREREDKERRDAEAAGNIDKVLKHLDGPTSASASTRWKNVGSHADADPEREEWMRDDAAMCARDDAEEARELDRLQREEGMAQPVAADAARTARRDRVKARKDMQRRDSAPLRRLHSRRSRREMQAANLRRAGPLLTPSRWQFGA